ncbi:hypothetical protein SAY86_030620 [Trapa natans]|uniref:Uncharacterized protein n=1 Tax=Trapa natans TaxID=22666 RepID=A0AAN7M429_TRANT|nr:hypothetical protein SAY86_030620 [Trapa natans]
MDTQNEHPHEELQEPLIPNSSNESAVTSPPPPASHGLNPRLEKVLTDPDLPRLKRLTLATWIEMGLLSSLAAPAIFVYMINNFMSLSTRIFAGHLGNLELAAASLGNSGIQLFAYGLMPILLLFGESSAVASDAAIFVYGLIPQIFGYATNFPIQKFLQAQSIVVPSAYISVATLGIHLLLSWVAVYKLGLGLIGASLVLSLSWWIIVASQFVYIVASGRCKETWRGFSPLAFTGLWEFVKLSAASAVMLCLETWYFQVLVLIAGLLPDPELALDSLAVCMAVMGLLFMVSVGFNAAASVRVSNELGAGHPRSAAFCVVVVNLVSFVVAVVEAAVVMGLRHVISYAFTGGETVANAVSGLCPFLAVSLVLNGVQPVLSGKRSVSWQPFSLNLCKRSLVP